MIITILLLARPKFSLNFSYIIFYYVYLLYFYIIRILFMYIRDLTSRRGCLKYSIKIILPPHNYSIIAERADLWWKKTRRNPRSGFLIKSTINPSRKLASVYSDKRNPARAASLVELPISRYVSLARNKIRCIYFSDSSVAERLWFWFFPLSLFSLLSFSVERRRNYFVPRIIVSLVVRKESELSSSSSSFLPFSLVFRRPLFAD